MTSCACFDAINCDEKHYHRAVHDLADLLREKNQFRAWSVWGSAAQG